MLRVPYPMGFHSRGMDGRIDDPNAGWKGRGIYATYGADADVAHRRRPEGKEQPGEVPDAAGSAGALNSTGTQDLHMPLRILVVEDFAPFRHRTCAALQQREEFQTIEAADGLEAVQKAEALQPDLVLLNISLPKMHGFEVAKRIGRLVPHARLFFLSQESSSEIVREALKLGTHGYSQKVSAATDCCRRSKPHSGASDS